jgi:serine/threonine protein kinase
MTEERVADRWPVVSTLAVRDASTTRLCRDATSGKLVVVKTLSLRHAKDQQDVVLFEREARVLRGLDVPRVPRFVDSVVEEIGDDVRLHLVQEHVAGRSLLAAVQDGRRFSPEEVARLGVALCGTLAALHGASPPLIHRDVKPANVVLDDAGDPWLVDFGAVKADAPGGASRGVTVVGTYGYMAPEQYEGRAGPSSDVFALAYTLWFLLAHKEPWEFDEHGPRAALAAATNVPEPLRRALLDATAPDVAVRTKDAPSFAASLQRSLRGDEAPAPRTAAAATSRSRAPVVVAAAALVVVAVVGAFVLATAREEPAPEPAALASAPGDPLYKVPAPSTPQVERLFGDDAVEGAMRCLDRAAHRIFQSRGRYLTWADATRGPTS